MADTNVTPTVDSNMHARYLLGPYWHDKDTAVMIFPDNSADINYTRTTDAGTNWTDSTIEVGDCYKAAAWYDKETPGDTGNIIHIVYYDGADSYVRYVDYNISTNSLGTAVTIASSVTSLGIDGWIDCSITKSVDGNLYVCYVVDGAYAFYRSTDDGANWTSRSDVYEAGMSSSAPDQVLLFPADTGDDSDIAALYFDDSAAGMSIKMYDDSANSWTETALGTGMSGSNGLDRAIRDSKGRSTEAIQSRHFLHVLFRGQLDHIEGANVPWRFRLGGTRGHTQKGSQIGSVFMKHAFFGEGNVQIRAKGGTIQGRH